MSNKQIGGEEGSRGHYLPLLKLVSKFYLASVGAIVKADGDPELLLAQGQFRDGVGDTGLNPDGAVSIQVTVTQGHKRPR